MLNLFTLPHLSNLLILVTTVIILLNAYSTLAAAHNTGSQIYQIPFSKDTILSAITEEQFGNNGSSKRLKVKEWTNTAFQFYLNNKITHHKEYQHTSAPWIFDEPVNTQDFWTLRWYGKLRLKAFTRGQQLIEYLLLISKFYSLPHYQIPTLLPHNMLSSKTDDYLITIYSNWLNRGKLINNSLQLPITKKNS